MNHERNRENDVICFGRIGVDLIPTSFNKCIEDVSAFKASIGGTPSNIAVGCAKLGLKTGFIGKVSSDALGRFALSRLKGFGVDTSHVKEDAAANSLAVLEVASPSEHKVCFYRDNPSDLKIECRDIDEEYIANAGMLVFSGTALAASPSREAVFLAAEYARRHNTTTVMDIDYRLPGWNSLDETCCYYRLLCERCDIIIGTREEFEIVNYFCRGEELAEDASARQWLERQSRIVVVKHGAEGSVAYTRDGRVHRCKAYPAETRKAFGAGDAFAASFLAGLIKGETIERAMRYGAAAAAIVVSKDDCSMALPTVPEVEAFMRRCDGAACESNA